MIETKAIQKNTTDTLAEMLRSRKDSIAQIVPSHLTPERVMRVAVNCVAKTPGLQACTPTSLLQSVLVAAELGLEPGGALGHMYLVPFGNVCTPIIGYRGLAELARRSGEVVSVSAAVVREKDKFKVSLGLKPDIQHEPDFSAGELSKPTFFYAVAVLSDGSTQFEVMSVAQVDAIRARSRSGKNGPWATDYEEMAKKTVFRRLAKWLPIASERFEKGLEIDNGDYVDTEVAQQVANPAATSMKERVKSLRDGLDAPAEIQAEATPEMVEAKP